MGRKWREGREGEEREWREEGKGKREPRYASGILASPM